MRKLTVLWIILLALVNTGSAEIINTTGQLFLIEPGARSMGMGGCGTLLGEATGGLYNPAAQALIADVAGTIFSNPHPYYSSNFAFLSLTAAARTEFGYFGASYLSRKGVDGSLYPPEEASALVLAGRPSKRIPLALGFALKILTTQKANFIPINQSPASTYKMAFDLGAVYNGLFPKWTIGQADLEDHDLRMKFGCKFQRGLSFGLAFQNLGGRVKFEQALDPEMLPQTFRADILWGTFESRYGDVKVAGQLQKLLVSRNEQGGYASATTSFFQAWGGGDRQGGWTSRLGVEISALGLISGRIGWSIDHKDHRSYQYRGIGLGPEWLRINAAWVRESVRDVSLEYQSRYDVSANVSFEQMRRWLKIN
ncbi:MAG: hypothetical protein NTW14_04215 [bacterium]|nr:hypothetical protein [bacterium]